ncbi:MAG: hypothetical protein ACYSWP_12265 [Planctomycetota bacterium]|jgi:hypothetical protein
MQKKQLQQSQVVISPGASQQVFACKVKSLVSHNFYNVVMIGIGDPGSIPIEIGDQFQAVDLTDNFINPASDVPLGSIVSVSRVGSKYIFQKP